MTGKSLKEQVQKLLWSGEATKAEELLSSEESAIEDEITKTQAELVFLKKRKAEVMELSAGRDGYKANASQSTQAKTKRNNAVIALAKGKAVDGIVNTNTLLLEVAKKGIDLGVPSNREATVISNILFRSGGFTKIDTGEYQVPSED